MWDAARSRGATAGMYFWQQSLGESVDCVVSPAPIHKHGGGMVMSCYTKPTGMAPILEKLCGKFPLWRYWGPLASPKVGRKCVSWFEAMTDAHDVDEAYLYLPTLDYAAQRSGPGSSAARAALKEFRRQLERIPSAFRLQFIASELCPAARRDPIERRAAPLEGEQAVSLFQDRKAFAGEVNADFLIEAVTGFFADFHSQTSLILDIKKDRIAAIFDVRSGLEKRYSVADGEFESIRFAILGKK